MNNKSITERLNNVRDKGPDKWLSRALTEKARKLGQRLGGETETIRAKDPKNKLNSKDAQQAQKIIQQSAMQRVADAENTGQSKAAKAERGAATSNAERLGITRGGRPVRLEPPEGRFKPVGVEGEPVPDYEGGNPAGRAGNRRPAQQRATIDRQTTEPPVATSTTQSSDKGKDSAPSKPTLNPGAYNRDKALKLLDRLNENENFSIPRFETDNSVDESASIIDGMRDHVSRDELYELSGVNYQQPAMQGMNDLIALHYLRDRMGTYQKEAEEDNQIPDYERFDKDTEIDGVKDGKIDLDNPDALANLARWSQDSQDKIIKRSRIQLPQEAERLMEIFGEGGNPDLLKPENLSQLITNSRPMQGKIDDSHIDSFIDTLGMSPDKIGNTFGILGYGGGGGRAQNLSQEEKNARGRAAVKTYLEQGGRDGYTGLPMSIFDLTADHMVSEGNEDFHRQRAQELGIDPDKWQSDVANSFDHNYTLTRFGLNTQKLATDLPKFVENIMKKGEKGRDSLVKEFGGNSLLDLTRGSMESNYYKVLENHIKSLIKDGKFTPEVYNEIFDTYKRGNEEIEGRVPRNSAGHRYSSDNTNSMVDVWRMLGDRSIGGFRNFAHDGPREKATGNKAPWYGIAGGTTSPSNAGNSVKDATYPKSRRPSYVWEDNILDNYRDAMFRLKFSGGKDKAKSLHDLSYFLGTGFATGNFSAEEWTDYIDQATQGARNITPENWQGKNDDTAAGTYKSNLINAMNSNNIVDGDRTNQGTFAGKRSIRQLFEGKQNNPQDKSGAKLKETLSQEIKNALGTVDADELLDDTRMYEEFSAIIEGKLDLKGTLDAFF